MSLLRQLSLSLRWGLGRVFLPRKKVRAGNIQFTLSCNNPITHYRWKNCLTKELLTTDWIEHHISESGVFFDIGANIGEFSIYAALSHPKLRVVAFEPEYSNLNLLKENILANGLQARVEPFGFAMGKTTGLSWLHLQDVTPGSAKHTASKNFLEQTAEKCPVVWREGICTYTLDQFCREMEIRPNFIKLDVDGNEPDILEGGRDTLANPNLKSMIMEFSHDVAVNSKCGAILQSAGLKLKAEDPPERLGLWVRS